MYIDFLVYDDPNLNMTDQIQVPLTIWEKYGASTDTPTFMRVNGTAVGRIVPAEIYDSCRIPTWMWSLCGEPLEFVELEVVSLPIATSITLKPQDERGEPVALEDMTAALSASWSCLSVGATLQLVCGTYDVISILAVDTEVPAACILDCDVDLILLDFVKQDTEEFEHIHEPVPETETIDFSQMFTAMPKPDLFPGQGRTLGGQGRRLG
jgi:hypothetical protein